MNLILRLRKQLDPLYKVGQGGAGTCSNFSVESDFLRGAIMFFKQRILALALAVAGPLQVQMACAQGAVRPLSSSDIVQAETSRTAKTTWLGKLEGWEKYEPRRFTVTRDEGTVQTLRGAVEDIAKHRIDTESFTHIGYTQDASPEVISATTTRTAGPLMVGMKWSSQITYLAQPASWCESELKMALDGTYEVETEESYSLRIDGNETRLSVFPIAQRGTWRRCYKGKLYQRFLWSPDLQSFLAIEFQTYNPLGKLHEASFSMRVKEIVRGREGGQQ